MKKTFSFLLLLFLSFYIFAAAKTKSGLVGKKKSVYNQGDTYIENIIIGDKTHLKTGEIVVVPDKKVYRMEFKDNSSFLMYMDYNLISDGSYYGKMMGVFVEGRRVELSPFAIGQYPVTQELYNTVISSSENCNPSPSSFKRNAASGEKQELRPVDSVNWYDAIYFCNELSKLQGLKPYYVITDIKYEGKHIKSASVMENVNDREAHYGYRLPSETEWEFAARGGNPYEPEWFLAYGTYSPEKKIVRMPGDYPEDEDYVGREKTSLGYYDPLNEYIWFGLRDYKNNKTHEVGLKKANRLNLYDMCGNVYEWVWDEFGNFKYDVSFDAPYIKEKYAVNPMGAKNSKNIPGTRVVRGGDCGRFANECTVSSRQAFYPYQTGSYSNVFGFRVCRYIK